MKEKDDLKDRLIKLMISNIIGFAIIFVVCGIFIFLMVRNITYKGVDSELLKSKDLLLSIDKHNEISLDMFEITRNLSYSDIKMLKNSQNEMNENQIQQNYYDRERE